MGKGIFEGDEKESAQLRLGERFVLQQFSVRDRKIKREQEYANH